MELIFDLSPVADLGELIHEWIQQRPENEWSGPAVKLYAALKDHMPVSELRGYVRDGADLGWKLRQLSMLDGWKERVERGSRRFGPKKQKQTIWTIRTARPIKGDRGDSHFSTLSTREKINV